MDLAETDTNRWHCWHCYCILKFLSEDDTSDKLQVVRMVLPGIFASPISKAIISSHQVLALQNIAFNLIANQIVLHRQYMAY